eukprot:CAMPEP_0119529498 /NCGR_PEP_ID=MMETSP1344-20130328/43498_1 /TAXON_ID=236787 /ORGANISM="Florenciella parvula, Strain CCMP2471" /LENGTH=37 /DNA_ID= /DNA_START= /DNA_END= /DNA_ORIENTATION=
MGLNVAAIGVLTKQYGLISCALLSVSGGHSIWAIDTM